MNNIAEKTLQAIERKNIRPTPRWFFVARNGGFWLIFLVLIIAGALASATAIFLLANYDWDIYQNLHRSFIAHFFYSIPYFWIAVLSMCVAFAYFDFKNTKTGYRYNVALITSGSVLLSLVLGALFFYRGLDSQIDDFFDEGVPFYGNVVYDDRDIWDNADKGLLGGMIVDVENENAFTLRDVSGNFWEIEGDRLAWLGAAPKEGAQIKLIGQDLSGRVFSATSVRPWSGR